MRITDTQAQDSTLRSLDRPNPLMPMLPYAEGPKHDMPITLPLYGVYICLDTGEAFIYISPLWGHCCPLTERPREMKWAGIPFYATDTDEVYIWM
jgi:hypothetical protein